MKENPSISPKEQNNAMMLLSVCDKCKKLIKVEYYNESFEKSRIVFLGREGTESIHYCPYCGHRSSGFSPDDPDELWHLDELNCRRETDEDVEGDDPVDMEEPSWWPDFEDDFSDPDYQHDDTDFNTEMDMSKTETFLCSSCNEKFRIDPKECASLFCLFCGNKLFTGKNTCSKKKCQI